MNIQQLRYFTVLCDKGSFGKAAESLFITQQGLSMAIANLEAELSCQLFQRTAKGVVLTDAGKFFRVRVNRILSALRECTYFFQDNADDPSAIKVAGGTGILTEYCASMIRTFEQEHPSHTVFFREYPDSSVEGEVDNENAEIGFALEPLDTARFEVRRVLRRSLVLLLPEDHPLCAEERIPLSALTGENLIVVDDGYKNAGGFTEDCRNAGIPLNPRFRVREIGAVHQLVQQGWGIGMTMDTVYDSLATPGTVCRRLQDKDLVWYVNVFKKRNHVLSDGAQAFYDFILEHAEDVSTDTENA